MRIHNQVRAPACLTERHVDRWDDQPNYSFLSVSRRELITDFRDTRLPCHHLDDVFLLLVASHDNSVDMNGIVALKNLWLGLVRHGLNTFRFRLVRDMLVDEDVSVYEF